MLNSKPKNFSDLVDGDTLYIVSAKARSDIDFQKIYEVPFFSLNPVAGTTWSLILESRDLPGVFFDDIGGIVANRSKDGTKFRVLMTERDVDLSTMVYGHLNPDGDQTIITTSRGTALEWCEKKYDKIIDRYYDKIESYFERIEELEDLFGRWKRKNYLEI